MFIDFEKLENSGFVVETSSNGVTIRPDRKNVFPETFERMRDHMAMFEYISPRDAEELAENVFDLIEYRQIINIIKP